MTKFNPFEYSVKMCNELGKANLLLEFVETNAHDPRKRLYQVLYKNTHERATAPNITQKDLIEKYMGFQNYNLHRWFIVLQTVNYAGILDVIPVRLSAIKNAVLEYGEVKANKQLGEKISGLFNKHLLTK